jgi:hypothetical protein
MVAMTQPNKPGHLPWQLSLLILLWLVVGLPAVALAYLSSGPGTFPASIRQVILPAAITLLLALVVATPLLARGLMRQSRVNRAADEMRQAEMAAFRATLAVPRAGQVPGRLFMRAGRQVLIRPDGIYYFGPVIASPEFIILLPTSRRSNTSIGIGAGVGGLAGAAAAALIDRPKDPMAPLAVPVPAELLRHPDWPENCRDYANEAIALRRDACRNVRYARLRGMQFDFGPKRVTIFLSPFGRSKTLSDLRRLGWLI